MNTKASTPKKVINPADIEDDDENENRTIDKAVIFFDRARKLSLLSGGSSLELERQLRDLYKSLSFGSDEIRFYMLLGKTYRLHLDLTSAMFCYRYVLNREPSNIAARRFLVELLVLKGKELMMLGVQYQWKAKFTAARACFDESLEYNRENLNIWILKTVCHVQAEELTEAFEAISKVIKPNRELPAEVYILRAKIYWGRGLIEQGNQDIRIAASIDDKHPEVLAYISRAYAKSEKLYQQALQRFQEERYKESLEIVEHAIFITAEDIKLHMLKSKLHRKLNMLQDAYDAIMKAKSIFDSKNAAPNPDDPLASPDAQYQLQYPPDLDGQINLILNEYALNYAMEGNYQQAILLLNKIIRSEENLARRLISSTTPSTTTRPNTSSSAVDHNSHSHSSTNPFIASTYYVNSKYYMNRGDCYRALQDFPAAIADYQHALQLDGNDWSVRTKLSLSHYLIATDYFNSSKFIAADIELTKAIEYNPKVSEYFSLRGKTRYYLADYENSYFDYKQCLQLNPENAEIALRLQQYESSLPTNNPPSKTTVTNTGTESDPLQISCSAPSSSASVSSSKTKKTENAKRAQQEREKTIRKLALEITHQLQSNQEKPDPHNHSNNARHDAKQGFTTSPQIMADGIATLLLKTTHSSDSSRHKSGLQQQEQERHAKLQELLMQSRYKTDRKVKSISIEPTDQILMMLNPQKAATLPPLKLLTNEAVEEDEDIKKKQQRKKILQPVSIQTIHSVSLTHPSSIGTAPVGTTVGASMVAENSQMLIPTPPTALPDVLQKSNFRNAYLAAHQSAQKASLVKQEYDLRTDISRGPMWKMISAARELAVEATKPVGKSKSQSRNNRQTK